MSNAFVKGYLNSLKKREYHGGSDKLKNSTLIGALVGLSLALYVAHQGPKINDLVLLLIKISAFGTILLTLISLLLYVKSGINLVENSEEKVLNVLGIKTTRLEKIFQEVLMVLQSILVLMLAINGRKNSKLVFQMYGIVALVGFGYQIYLLYFSKNIEKYTQWPGAKDPDGGGEWKCSNAKDFLTNQFEKNAYWWIDNDSNIFTIKDLPKYEKSIYNDKKINLQYKDEEVADKSLKEISPETKCINGYYDFTRTRNRNSFMHSYDKVNFKVGKKPYPDVTYDKHGKVIDLGEPDKEAQEDNQKAGIACFKTCTDYFNENKKKKHYELRKRNKNYLLKTDDPKINNMACLKKKKNTHY